MNRFVTLIAALLTANLFSSVASADNASPFEGSVSTEVDAKAEMSSPPAPSESESERAAYDACVKAAGAGTAGDLMTVQKNCAEKVCGPGSTVLGCTATPAATPARPKGPSGPVMCEYPDGSRVEKKGLYQSKKNPRACNCDMPAHGTGPNYVDVFRFQNVRACVLWKVALANVTAQSEKCGSSCADLGNKIALLSQRLDGMPTEADLDELRTLQDTLAGRLDALEADVKALKANDKEQDEKLDDHEGRLTKLEEEDFESKQSNFAFRLDPLVDFGFRGRAGGYFGLGAHAEIEADFPGTVVGVALGGNLGIQAYHPNNTFGSAFLSGGDLTLRIYFTMERIAAFDVGGSTTWFLMAEHESGYRGLKSAVIGSRHGPFVGVLWDFSERANTFFRCGLGFGPVNTFGRATADAPLGSIELTHPAQPWCAAGIGLTLGKNRVLKQSSEK